jgi:uracil-DNA glycosylase
MPVAKCGIVRLIKSLVAFEAPNVFNPWRHTDVWHDDLEMAAPARRIRIEQHFRCTPRFLLVGEAPGYQGCHFSGVPFTNEASILAGRVPRVDAQRFTRRIKPWSEPSATIVWNHLHKLSIADVTVMWNAFAWHPYKPGNPMSNRAPTPQELRLGLPVLHSVLSYFKAAKVIAVGNVAEKTLLGLGVQVVAKVRHPSMGGANQFREQLASIVG